MNEKTYKIQVKYTLDAMKWHTIYTGPWNRSAAYRYHHNSAALVRVVYVPSEAEISAKLAEHPDLKLLDEYLDDWYVIEGSPDDPPNRTDANVKRIGR
ncbi:hypothetical protein [Amycolatopsis anabasis]|uniref:hypothetical protein n=1 Tax=Amycolatopsis anabasis TaxID=1840409 RepID=UPI00131BFC5C|nr:hypothetical protein [Amycolatopsis anabasis]